MKLDLLLTISLNVSSRVCSLLQNAPGVQTVHAKTYAERIQPASVYAPQSNPDKTVAEEDLFKINPKTVKDYLAKKVQSLMQV